MAENEATEAELKEAVAEAANSTATMDPNGLEGSITKDATEEK